MRKWMHRIVAALLVVACVLCFPWAMGKLPVEPRRLLMPPMNSWEGILTIGVVETWGSEGFVAWLNARAREFEKLTPGTLVAISRLNETAYQSHKENGTLPDIVLLPAYVEQRPAATFIPLAGHLPIKEGILQSGQNQGQQYGLPICVGAYGLMGNVGKMDGLQLGPDSSLQEVAEGMALSGRGIACAVSQQLHPETALKAMLAGAELPTQYGIRARLWPDFALEQKSLFYVATQREVRRMAVLQSAGRGFETLLLTPGQSFTDQSLMFLVTRPQHSGHGVDFDHRASRAAQFAALLLSEDAQGLLASAGVFATAQGVKLYKDGGMAQLEQALEGALQMPCGFDPF